MAEISAELFARAGAYEREYGLPPLSVIDFLRDLADDPIRTGRETDRTALFEALEGGRKRAFTMAESLGFIGQTGTAQEETLVLMRDMCAVRKRWEKALDRLDEVWAAVEIWQRHSIDIGPVRAALASFQVAGAVDPMEDDE